MGDAFGRKPLGEDWKRLCDEADTLRAQRDSLVAALENAPDFGGKPSTAFGRQYRDWQEEVATAIAAVKQEGEGQ